MSAYAQSGWTFRFNSGPLYALLNYWTFIHPEWEIYWIHFGIKIIYCPFTLRLSPEKHITNGSCLPCCPPWRRLSRPLCWRPRRSSTVCAPAPTAACTWDTGSCLAARRRDKDCGLHLPSPPAPSAPSSEPEHVSQTGDLMGQTPIAVCADHRPEPTAESHEADQQPLPSWEQLSELGQTRRRCSSAGPAGTLGQIYSSTFWKCEF